MIGFIGAGNMGSAIINGMIASGIPVETIIASAKSQATLDQMSSLGLNVCSSNREVTMNSQYIFLAIKPHLYDSVLTEIKDVLTKDKVLVIMAAGYSIARTKEMTSIQQKVVRTMPNTPALVGAGFTVVCFDELVTPLEIEQLTKLLATFSVVKEISESQINAYSALTGSSPAFVSMLIEAMADAGVMMGIPRKDAYHAVQHTLLGSAKLAVESGKHPGELKDMVCSPGGTTIEGVRTLEEKGFRSTLIEALLNTYKKNFDLTKIR